jgi:3-oxoacid CoA-transferase
MAGRYTTKAFGQVMGKAAKVTIVEAENIVPVGDIHPDNVHLQGIYVDRIVPSTVEKVIEIQKLKEVKGQDEGKKSEALLRRERIARRTSKELKHGYYVNLGVGEFAGSRGLRGGDQADESRNPDFGAELLGSRN